jgi:molecular chaperone DnaK
VIVDYVVDEFMKQEAIDLRKDPMALQRVRDEAEKAKKELSATTNYDINLPYITVDATGPKNLMMSISRQKFEELIGALVERSLEPCKKVMSDAGLNNNELHTILLV